MGWLGRAWRRKYLVAACAAAAAGIAYFAGLSLSKTYTARAGITISRSRVRVKLDEKYRIISGEEMTTPGSVALGKDLDARQRALLALVVDPGIAQQIADRFGGNLPPEYRNPAALLACVDVESSSGDLFYVSVRTGDAALSARIANAWAECYEAKANEIYASVMSGATAVGIEAETERARTALHASEAALRGCLESSREQEMNARLQYAQTLLGRLADERSDLVCDTLSRTHDARMRVVEGHMDAAFRRSTTAVDRAVQAKIDRLVGMIGAVEETTSTGAEDASREELRVLLRRRHDALEQVKDARSLLAQIQSDAGHEAAVSPLAEVRTHGNGPATGQDASKTDDAPSANEIAPTLASLGAGLFQSVRSIDQQIDLLLDKSSAPHQVTAGDIRRAYEELFGKDVSEPTPAQARHLDLAHAEAKKLIAMDDVDLEGVERASAGSWEVVYKRIAAELATATAQISDAEGERKRLELERDVALDQYGSLLRKKQEITLSKLVPGTEVKFVVTAVPPNRPSSPSAALCGMLGGLLGAALAIAAACLGPEGTAPASRVLSGAR